PQGSTASVEVISSEPLRSATFTVNGKRIPAAATTQPVMRIALISVQESGSYQLQMTSRNGLAMASPFTGTIRAIPDLPPDVRLLVPSAGVTISGPQTSTIPYRAQDDHGLAS